MCNSVGNTIWCCSNILGVTRFCAGANNRKIKLAPVSDLQLGFSSGAIVSSMQQIQGHAFVTEYIEYTGDCVGILLD